MATGREIYGQPKKGGEPKLEVRGDLFVGTVSRNGIDVITVTMAYKQQRAQMADMAALGDFRTNINLKVVPNVDGSDAIRQLTRASPLQYQRPRMLERRSHRRTAPQRPSAGL